MGRDRIVSEGDADILEEPEDFLEGDADILEEPKKDYFPPDFKEYMLKEQLKWCRSVCYGFYNSPNFGWVFWSQQDHEIEPSPPLENCADFNPKVRDNIRRALQQLLSSFNLSGSLVQFWAPTRTSEGRILLTTRSQPFVIGVTSTADDEKHHRQELCNYRMKMCTETEYEFYADTESGEEHLGLPARVFLHKFPESAPFVSYYSKKEYPQRDFAVSCNIKGSWAVPMFQHSSQTCVGVLEMVALYSYSSDWQDESFLRNMHDIFQEHDLQCLHGYQACEVQPLLELGLNRFDVYRDCEEKFGVKGIAHAFQELNMVLRSVCEIHELPLALTWVPCSACNGLRQCKLGSRGVEFSLGKDLDKFLRFRECYHLRKGLVAGRALSSSNMLYCSDITKLSVDEYPLVPYARLFQLSGWFTICLQSFLTGSCIYVLEFFLSARSKYDENIPTTLSFILGTIEEKFKTFRLASGKQLGELMPFEAIYFQNDQKFHSIQRIQATREFSMSSIPSSVQSSPSVANTRSGFQDAITVMTKYDPSPDADMFSDSDPSFEQSTASVANTRPGLQDANMVTIKAKYASIAIVFKLSLPCRLVELQQKVAERLELKAGTYHVGYKAEEDEFVLIPLDEDLQAYVKDSLSHGNTSTVVLLKSKEPATNLNPTN